MRYLKILFNGLVLVAMFIISIFIESYNKSSEENKPENSTEKLFKDVNDGLYDESNDRFM